LLYETNFALFAQGPALSRQLEQNHWVAETHSGKQQEASQVIFGDEAFLILFNAVHIVPYQLSSGKCKKQEVGKDKEQEILVVAVAKAVVDERTVMVEHFCALATEQTMEGGLRLYQLAVGAQVHQVPLLV
jgi:hypothetical protein